MATIPFAERFNDPKFTNPGDNLDPKRKQNPDDKEAQEWFRRKMEYMYSCYIRDDAYIPYSAVVDYRINRLYAQGRQPNVKYREMLTLEDRKTGMRKGWMNISWDILPILPKFRNVVLGRFSDIDYNTQVHAIDDFSSTMREDAKLTMLAEANDAELQMFKELIGIQSDEQKLPFVPKNIEELDMLANMGCFKLAWETTMDKLLIATSQACNWSDIKARVLEDAVDLGIIAVKDYTDPVSGKPMVRYVDPAYLIIRQNRSNDFTGVTEAAEITWYSVQDLKAWGLTDAQIEKASQSYNGVFGNPYLSGIPGYPQDRNRYDYLKIAVLDAEFESFDNYYYESRMIGGNEVFFDLPFGSTKGTSRKNKFGVRQYQKRYRCKWVIGTDIIFDYGLQYDQPYDQEVRPKSSYHCYRIAEKSLISQCIAVADDIQLAVLKFRNAMAESRPAGVMIEMGTLKDISLGGAKLEPFDVLKIYRDRGDLLYRNAILPNGMPMQGGIPPIQELKGGIGPYLDELIKVLDWNTNLIREITGINQITDASTPSASALVGVAELAEQGTNNVLKPILMGYKSMKQRCFRALCQRWQLAGMFYPQSVPFSKQGNASVQIIKVGKDLYNPVFDVDVDMRISEADKAQLEQACLASIQAAKTGSIGITLSDYIYIKELMAVNNMRAAWIYLSYREQKMKEDADATSAQMQAMNAKMQQDAQAQQSQAQLTQSLIMEEEKRRTIFLQGYMDMLNNVVKKTGQLPPEMQGAAQMIPPLEQMPQQQPPMPEQGQPMPQENPQNNLETPMQ